MTRKRLTFAEMIAYLDGIAAEIKDNSVGEIAVAVIGIDAVKRRRRRAPGNQKKKAPVRKGWCANS
jgi:hypothetical protein